MTEIATLRPVLPTTVAPSGETEVLPHNIEAEQQLLGAIGEMEAAAKVVQVRVRCEAVALPRA